MYDKYGEFADFYNIYFRSHTCEYLWLVGSCTYYVLQLKSTVKTFFFFFCLCLWFLLGFSFQNWKCLA